VEVTVILEVVTIIMSWSIRRCIIMVSMLTSGLSSTYNRAVRMMIGTSRRISVIWGVVIPMLQDSPLISMRDVCMSVPVIIGVLVTGMIIYVCYV